MFRIIGITYEEGKKRKICYADDFDDYCNAYNYADYLSDTNNWDNNDLPGQPVIIYIEEY